MDDEIEFPPLFRCPISMELMQDPVAICTGVTYDRRSIEKWLFHYEKKTCPATMQRVESFDVTPNHTLRRLILAWKDIQSPSSSCPPSPPPSSPVASLLEAIETTPFKVSSLKKLRALLETGDDEVKTSFVHSGGIDAVVRVLSQAGSVEGGDFLTFRSCEEALGVLHQLPLLPLFSKEEHAVTHLLWEPETVRAVTVMLQRGSADARFHAVTILRNLAKFDQKRGFLTQNEKQGADIFKPLLELVSDDISASASSRALEVMIGMLEASKKNRLKVIEAGGVHVLVEVLPESNSRSKCEKILLLLKLLCECADGRLALEEHRMGIAAVAKKMSVSDAASKIGTKAIWLMAVFHPTERVVEDMMVFGAAEKLLNLLHVLGGRPSRTKEKVVRVLRMHGGSWMHHPCCPHELKVCLGSENGHF